MEWVETTGRSVDEALEIALDQLGVDAEDAEVVIVTEAKSGLFGLGRAPARIRARVRPAVPRPKRPRRTGREGRSSGSGGRSAGSAGGARVKTKPAEGNGAPRREDARSATSTNGGRTKGERSPSRSGNGAAERDDDSRGAMDRPAPRRNRRGGRGRAGAAVGTEEGASASSFRQEDQMSVEQQAAQAVDFVRGVVERFGLVATTGSRIDGDHVFVDVRGDELGLLVGPRGATLDALQELTRTVVQRRGEEHGTRVIVDVAGYRERRAAALAAFVSRVAAEVASTGEAQALEPMNAPDRKIVHDTVNAIDGLATTSEGVDPHRYVVIRQAGAAQATAEPESDVDLD